MPGLLSPFAMGTRLAVPVLAVAFWLAPMPAAAQTRSFTASVPNYDGPVHPVGPFPALSIGTFTYTLLPGESIAAAQVRGTWGNNHYALSTAGVDLFVDGILVAQCVTMTTCWFDSPPDLVPWSFNFAPAQLAQLNDGQAVMTGQQTSMTQVYLGTLRLDLTINTPPILTVTGSGTGSGTITSQAGLTPAINCTITAGVASGNCQRTYPLNTVVTLTAAGTGGSSFDGWSGSCASSPCTVTMSQTRASSAAFTAPAPQTLTVSGAGTGNGTVTSQAGLSPAINCTITAGVTSGACSQTYPFNTGVTLTATPTGGGTFGGWSGSCGGSGTCGVTMSQARGATATFTAPAQTLTVSGAGSGNGTVTSQAGLSPAINCTITAGVTSGTCSQSYPFNTGVTLTATATGGGTFSGWSSACGGDRHLRPDDVAGAQRHGDVHGTGADVDGVGRRHRHRHGDLAGRADAGHQLHDHRRRGHGHVLAELPVQHRRDADRDGDGGRDLQRLVGLVWRDRHVRSDDVAGAHRHGRVHGGAADADGRRDRRGQRHGDVAGRADAGDQLHLSAMASPSGACSQSYPFNTAVTLTATATGGSTFSGWSGACSATGTCGLTMSQARNVTAGFVVGTLTISSMTPARGSTAGGTTVEVIGQGFVVGATSVSVGGVPAAHVAVRSTTRLSFVTPPRPAGSASIVVATSNASGSSAFTFVVPDPRRLTGARHPSFSFDGRYMAFESTVALVADDTNGVADVYVFDKVTDTLRRVSVSSVGAQALGGESQQPAVSATGRFVAFQSRAANLVPSDGNDLLDVFLHDRDVDDDGVFDEAGAIRTVRVSVGTGGVEALRGFSRNPSISGNGRWIAFETAANNLVGSDANSLIDVCVHDRLLGRTVRVSVSTAGGEAVGGDSLRPAISLDGRFVAFDSAASNLVADGNGRRDVFVHDRDFDRDGVMDEAGSIDTGRVSVSSSGAEAIGGDSTHASITQEGRFVAFGSTATNLVTNDTNRESDVFLRDRQAGETRRLSVAPGGGNLPGPSREPRISANGAMLVFVTSGSNAGAAAPLSASAVVAAVDDGKSTTGEVPSPTTPAPPPPVVDPVPPAGTVEDPDVSGDGSSSGTTIPPDPGTGGDQPDVVIDRIPDGVDEAPFISGLGPVSGPFTGGQIVEIQGGRFTAGAAVRWGAQTLTPLAGGTASLLRVTAPASPSPPPVAVDVQVQAGQMSSNVVPYTYLAAQSTPVITSVSPPSGPVTGQQTVTIEGTGFDPASVRFGASAATITAASPTAITVTTPPTILVGAVPVVVTNTDGGIAVSNGPYSYTPAAAGAPTITAVQPAAGPAIGGTTLTILGTQFTDQATVMLGGVSAAQVQFLSSSALVVTTPPSQPGASVLSVAVPGQPPATVAFEFRAQQTAVTTCSGGFDQDGDGIADDWEVQFGLSPADASDAAVDWDRDGRTNAQECLDETHPRGLYKRYLAEGATGLFFSTRVALANPGMMPARVLFRFLTDEGVTVRQVVVVPASARRTIDVETLSGLASANVSTVIESDAEVVIDRTMRWDQATRGGAHAEGSVPAPALRWYLAEGATHGAFDLFYLIQNPSLIAAASVRVRFLRPSGPAIERFYTVQANSRFTLLVDGIQELAATDVSAVIESLNGLPVIVERAMYSSAAGIFAAGHDSAGVTAPSTEWFFAEGATGTFFDLFLLFANPNATDAAVQATYLLPSGATVVRSYQVPASSRRTVYVANEDPALADTAVSIKVQVTNGVGIIAERSMWWPHGQAWYEAHNSAGATTTGTKWAVADGEHGAGAEATQTYLLIANTSAFAGALRVTLLLETGPPLIREYTVTANSRFNVPVGSDFGLAPGTRFGAVIESLGGTPARIVVERAMYWNAAGVTWAAGSNVLATRLQ